MKYSDIVKKLYEAIDVDKTLANYGDKLAKRYEDDHSAPYYYPENAIDAFTSKDPSPNQQYTLWLIRTYLNGGIRLFEDLHRAKTALSLFHKFKQKLPIKDIGQIKSLTQLEDLVEKVKEEKTSGEESKEQKKKIYDESEVIYKGSEGMIVVPKTEEASCFWGKGTKWCTAATHSQNMFGRYNDKGNLYILMYPDGVKYQFHLVTGQLMDEQDEGIDFDRLKKSDRYALFSKIKFTEEQQLAAIKQDQYAIRFIVNPSEEVQLAAVKKDGFVIEYINNPSEEVQLAAVNQYPSAINSIKNPSEEVQLAAVKQNGHVIRFIENPTREVQMVAINDSPTTINSIKNPSEEVQLAAVKQNGLTIRFIVNPSEEVQLAAVNQNGYAIKYIDSPSEEVQLAAVKYSPDVIENIKNPTKKATALSIKNAREV